MGLTVAAEGPIPWMDPESLANYSYSRKSDVWSFAIVITEIVNRKMPHPGLALEDVFYRVRDSGAHPQLPEGAPDVLKILCDMCFQKDPNDRPTMEEVCDILNDDPEDD